MKRFEIHADPPEKEIEKASLGAEIIKILAIIVFILLIVWATKSDAQERVLVLTGGLICNEILEVVEYVETEKAPEGCGWILGQLVAKVHPLHIFENEKLKIWVVKFDFFQDPDIGIQYGYIRTERKETDRGA